MKASWKGEVARRIFVRCLPHNGLIGIGGIVGVTEAGIPNQ